MQNRQIRYFAALVLLLPLNPARAQDAGAKTVPVFTIRGVISETPMGEDLLFGGAGGSESLKDLVARMTKVCRDDSVPAVVLMLGDASLGTGQIEEIRAAVDAIKRAGKKVHVHADSLSMGGYVLLSGATDFSVVPTGDIWISGLAAESPYLRGLLDMIGVEPDYLTCGAYKSAAEMFTRKGPSPEAAENLNSLLDGIYDTYVGLIAKGRGVEPEQVRQWIDQGLYSAEQAQQAGIIDRVQYRQDFVTTLRQQYGAEVKFDKRYGKKKPLDIDLSSPFGLFKFYMDLLTGTKSQKSTKDAVAVVYVEGPIVPGNGSPGGFPLASAGVAYSTPIRKALDEVARDNTVKAVVLRVNSPGGSAVASEIILNATKRVVKEKPLVVSMGDVAGSGGYYVACGAPTIFADESTITGSIGVVAGKLATRKMWDKVGIHWESSSRGKNAGMLSSSDRLTEDQQAQLQAWMDDVYEVFKGHVTAIRGDRLKKDIEDLAGGRVYTGRQALKLGLIDKLGGLDAAIRFAADRAHLEEYEIRVVPKPKDFIELLLSDLTDTPDDKTLSLPSARTKQPSLSLLDAALPLLKGLEPNRVHGVLKALRQLSVLQNERVLLTMPVIEITD